MLDSILLSIAKTAILSKFDNTLVIKRDALLKEYPYLANKGSCFVTLHKNKDLRGCIGSIIAHQSLLDDIIHNARSAAFSDPRFTPLDQNEQSQLHLEVSVLSEPKLLDYIDYADLQIKIRPKIDGLIIKYAQYQGTFLPQVWSQLPHAELFLEHLAYKAGATPSIYNNHPDIYTYQVDAIEEEFDAVLPL